MPRDDNIATSVMKTINRLRKKIRWPLVYCIALAILFSQGPMLFNLFYGYVDPSYNYGYAKAAADHLSFGDQFIATYGPLGYLIANYLPANLHRVMAWFAVYVIVLGLGVYPFCKMYIKRPMRRWVVATILLYALSATKGGGFMEWSYLLTFVLYGFVYLGMPKERKRTILLVVMALTAGWFSLMKFTLGLGALLSLLGLCVFGNETNRERLRQLAFGLGTYVVSFVALATLFTIHHLGAYVHSAMLLSGGFSSAMAQFDTQTVMATWFVGAALLLILLWPAMREMAGALRYAFLIPMLFEVWKYCVARQDSRLAIIIQVVFPLVIMVYCTLKVRIRDDLWIAALIVLLSVLSVWANKDSFRDDFMPIVTAPLVNARDHRFTTFIGRGHQTERWAVLSSLGLQQAALPQSMLDKIGHQGVDIFPWETSIIAANNLTWQNSPSPYSFQNFSPYLDARNAEFFDSSQAPPFIVWHHVGASGVHGVDFRHILWDSPETVRAILTNYQLVDSNNQFMLLQKRAQPLEIKQTTHTAAVKGEDQWIALSESDDTVPLVSLDVTHTLRGSLATFLVRDKQYVITVKDSNGKESSYRFVRQNSQDLLMGWLPKDWEELVAFVRDHRLPEKTVEFKVNTPLGSPVTVTDLRWIDKQAVGTP